MHYLTLSNNFGAPSRFPMYMDPPLNAKPTPRPGFKSKQMEQRRMCGCIPKKDYYPRALSIPPLEVFSRPIDTWVPRKRQGKKSQKRSKPRSVEGILSR